MTNSSKQNTNTPQGDKKKGRTPPISSNKKDNVANSRIIPKHKNNQTGKAMKLAPIGKFDFSTIKAPEGGSIMAAQASGAGVTNTQEVVYRVERYFDTELTTALPVNIYYFDEIQKFFAAGSEISETGNVLARPKTITAYVLPRARNSDVSTSTYVAACCVQANASISKRTLANVQNTVIKPDFNIEWKKVYHLNVDKTFRNTTLEPFMNKAGFSLFEISIINPDDGTVVTEPVQVRLVITYAQNMPPLAEISDEIVPVSSWTTGGTYTSALNYAQVQPLRIQNMS